MTEPRNTRRALPRIPAKVFAALIALLMLGVMAALMLYPQFDRYQNVAERAANRKTLAVAESVARNADALAAVNETTTNEGLIDALVAAAGEAYLDPDWIVSDEAAIRADSCAELTLRYGQSIADVKEATSHVRLAQPTDNVLFDFVVGEGPCPA